MDGTGRLPVRSGTHIQKYRAPTGYPPFKSLAGWVYRAENPFGQPLSIPIPSLYILEHLQLIRKQRESGRGKGKEKLKISPRNVLEG